MCLFKCNHQCFKSCNATNFIVSTVLKFKVLRFPHFARLFLCLCAAWSVWSRLQRRFSLCRSVLLKRLWTLLKCVLKQIITANDRVHDPGSCGCPRFNDLLLSPKRLVLVAQTSNFVSPKWTLVKKYVTQTSVAQTSCRPNDRTPTEAVMLLEDHCSDLTEANQKPCPVKSPAQYLCNCLKLLGLYFYLLVWAR